MSHRYDLYYSNYCYFCQKVLMRLRGREHPIGLRNTSETGHHRALAEGGGRTQVPCLRIESEDGAVQWMYESDDILEFIQQQGLLDG